MSRMRSWVRFALIVAVFAAGVVVGRGITVLWATAPLRIAELTPTLLRFERAPDIPAATDLRPLATFWEVRNKIKANFVYPIKDDRKLTYGAIRGMLEALDDPYSRFMTPKEYQDFQAESSGHFSGIGVYLERRKNKRTDEWEIVITSIIPGGPASRTDLKAGDVIIGVDGRSIEGMSLGHVVKLIKGPAGTKVKLTVKRPGVADPIDIEITRGDVNIPTLEYEMLPGNIGYIWLRTFNRTAPQKVRRALQDLLAKGMKALLLDLSQNPGGILDVAVSIADQFISEGPIVWIQERGQPPQPYMAHRDTVLPPDIPMVVLIDPVSASASEILAGCLQDHGRAVIVGQHSFGKNKVQTVIELNDGSALVLTTALYLTPKKRDIGREWAKGKKGIKPDVEFPEPNRDEYTSFEEWHEQQKKRAVEELKKLLVRQAAAQ